MKYLNIAFYSFKDSLVSLSDFIIMSIRPFTILFIQFFLFKYVFSHEREVGGYTFDMIVAYIFVVGFISTFVDAGSFPYKMESSYIKGTITTELVLPVDYYFFEYFKNLGQRLAFSLQFIMANLVLYILGGLKVKLVNVLFFLPSLFLAFTLNFSMYFIVGSLVFRFVKIAGITEVVRFLGGLIGGRLFPLSFLPEVVQGFITRLPFAYTVYFPANILLGKGFTKGDIIIFLLWTFLMAVSSILIFESLRKTAEGYGG